jgi:hypothetical protein
LETSLIKKEEAMANDNNDPNKSIQSKITSIFGNPSNYLAIAVPILVLALISYLSYDVISNSADTNRNDKIKFVFNSVLPIVSAWVLMILAFYFGKENLAAATNAIKGLSSPLEEKLQSIPIKNVMIKRKDMFVLLSPTDDKKPLKDILEDPKWKDKGERLPILSDKDFPLYIIHRSEINKFLTLPVLNAKTDAEKLQAVKTVQDFTLRNILDDKEFVKFFENTFALVKEDGTLFDAKTAMDKIEHCQDVFVTKGGTKDEPVTGYLTNEDIAENSRV